ncbi:MAG: hypothetical protein ACXVCO_20090 [Ktedonobacterales bacterium]
MAASKRDQVVAELRTAEEEVTLPHGMGDGTADRINRVTGISAQNVRKHLDKLYGEELAHIFCWTDSHPRAPVWVAGAGEHAPKPAPLPKEEIRRREAIRQRSRCTQKREVREAGWTRQATYACIERVRQTPQTWLSPLEVA